MRSRPGLYDPKYAAQFADASVVSAYQHRPPYPTEVFDVLSDLITETPRIVLDAGCGRGEIARPLAPRVARVDAVDLSAPMVEAGRRLPGGDDPRLRWIVGSVEDVPLSPPYALVAAASSLQWFDWDVAMPRFREVLSPGGCLAIVVPLEERAPWDGQMRAIRDAFTTRPELAAGGRNVFEVGSGPLMADMERRGLFEQQGAHRTVPVSFVRPVEVYIESWHSRSGFSRERMGAERAAAFDAAIRDVVAQYADEGTIMTRVVGEIIWGVPRGEATP